MQGLSVRRLYSDNQKKLALSWVAGSSGADGKVRLIDAGDKTDPSLVGRFGSIHDNQIQIIGPSEARFLEHKTVQDTFAFFLKFLIDSPTKLVVVTDDLSLPENLKRFCESYRIPLMKTPVQTSKVIDILQLYLHKALAPSTIMHGVFMNVFEVGTLLQGSPGLGKSELALELLSRGHSLIADDAVKIYKTGPDTLEGRCPSLLRDFLEVRGLGILNVRTMFGETAVRLKKPLKLIIQLASVDDAYMKSLDRLSMKTETQTILDVPVREIFIPVGPGRNIAVLTEAAVRNYILQRRGLNSMKEFLSRHQEAMADNKQSLLDDQEDAYEE